MTKQDLYFFQFRFYIKVQAMWASGSMADIALDDISLSTGCFETGNLSVSHTFTYTVSLYVHVCHKAEDLKDMWRAYDTQLPVGRILS